MDINKLLKETVERNASDLHLTPGLQPILRINGDLVPLKDYPVVDAEATKIAILGLMSEDQIDTFHKDLQLDFSTFLAGLAGFRVNAFHMIDGISAVFRVIPTKIPTLDELNSPKIFQKLLNLSAGLILVTGPTGCGKSTTLAAMVDYINTNQNKHIITIEDPIEFIHTSKQSLITQRQIYRDANDFSDALHAALREDPDVILVGEMRDLKTIRLALRAAETGHLVLATLHTSSSPRAISRMIDVFPAGEKSMIRNLISELIQAVVCQTLLNRVDGNGRVAAYEIMLGTTAIRNLIREDKINQMISVMQTSSQKGMVLMQQSIQGLIAQNLIGTNAVSESGFKRELFEDSEA